MADLILDVESLKNAIQKGSEFRYRFFWGHRPKKDGRLSDSIFSQWWQCEFSVDGQIYKSAEQFMMASKAQLFGDDETRAKILKADDPAYAKKLGREVRGFEENRWVEARFELVTKGNVAKFGADDKLRHHLLSTRDEILVEASPTDSIWGIGLAAENPAAQNPFEWRGLNLLGFALVKARSLLG